MTGDYMRSKEYAAFVEAYNDIDVRYLSDNELKHYTALCDNGLLQAEHEIYERRITKKETLNKNR